MMKKRKKLVFMISVAFVWGAMCMTGCGGNAQTKTETQVWTESWTQQEIWTHTETVESADTDAEQEIVLYADFSAGSEAGMEDGLIQTRTVTVQEITAESLAEALSQWSGLDFTLESVSCSEDAVTVDWAANSTLVAGLDDREQKEDFFFYDSVSLRWFMMDSLYRTLTENLGVDAVYYTMDGGRELVLEDLYPVNCFASDEPYMGSAYYYALAQQ